MKEKKKKTITWVLVLFLEWMFGALLLCFAWMQTVHAKGSMTVITIDAEDEISGNLLYAIDNKENFSEENTFEVENGTTHIVYVKDEAGNITEQTVIVPEESEGVTITSYEDPEDNEDTDYSTAPDSGYIAAESGGGTIADNTVTMGNSNNDGKQFLTVTTKNGHVFYIVIDNASSTDNVYLLDQVTEADLIDLIAEEDVEQAEEIAEKRMTDDQEKEDAVAETADQDVNTDEKKKKSSGMAGKLLMLVLIAGAAGIYMYFKKKKGQRYDEDELDEDAADLKENFEPVDDDDVMNEDAFHDTIPGNIDSDENKETDEELFYDEDDEDEDYDGV